MKHDPPTLDYERPDTAIWEDCLPAEATVDEISRTVTLPLRITARADETLLELGPYTFDALGVSRILSSVAHYQRVTALLDHLTRPPKDGSQ